jgi:2-methylcitrate dehydratase PrpD
MLTQKLIEHYFAYHWDDFSGGAVEAAKRCLLDTLGVLIKGSRFASSLRLKEALCLEPGKTPAPLDFALFFGTASHAVELDDFHREGTVHPGVVVIPAVLAVVLDLDAQGVKINGRDILRAVILGYDLMIRIGMAAKGRLYNKGFHPTALCGPFGSALAASLLYGHRLEQALMAQGIAGGTAAGLMAYKANGAWTKRLNAGVAARTGVLAARLAGVGFTGPMTILEDRFGFFHAFAPQYERDVLENLHTLEIEKITFKPYASCRFTHGPIEALRHILDTHSINVNEVVQVEVTMHEMAYKATMQPEERKYEPATAVDGQFSIPYCLAIMALHGDVGPDHFTADYLFSSEVRAWAKKVKGSVSDVYNVLFPAQNACQVTVQTLTARYQHEVLNVKGDPENPLSNHDLEEKFKRLTRGILESEDQRQLIDTVKRIEEMDDFRNLLEIIEKLIYDKN